MDTSQLTDEQKRIAWAAYEDAGHEPRSMQQDCLFAALEAVLASSAPAPRDVEKAQAIHIAGLPANIEEQLREAKKECEQAQQANELDRRSLHAIVREIESEITGRMWLIEGRGCYEWDDDKFRLEFGWAVKALREKLEPLRKIASDLSNSPKTEAGVNSVRKLEQECATLKAELQRICTWWENSYNGEVQAGEKLFAAFQSLRDERDALIERIAALEAENAALKAPVSYEEWGVIYDKAPSWVQGYSYLRAMINALIAARAKEPKEPTQDFPHVDSGEKR